MNDMRELTMRATDALAGGLDRGRLMETASEWLRFQEHDPGAFSLTLTGTVDWTATATRRIDNSWMVSSPSGQTVAWSRNNAKEIMIADAVQYAVPEITGPDAPFPTDGPEGWTGGP